jgi:hypothetical protein
MTGAAAVAEVLTMVEVYFDDFTRAKQEKRDCHQNEEKTRCQISHKVEDGPHF